MNRIMTIGRLIIAFMVSACHAEIVQILPNTINPDVLRIENFSRSQCQADSINFLLERIGTTIRAYGRNRRECGTQYSGYGDQFVIAERCIDQHSCTGPITAIEIRIVFIEDCLFDRTNIPECARTAPLSAVVYKQPVFFKAPTFQSNQVLSSGALLMEHRSAGIINADLYSPNTGESRNFIGVDALYSILTSTGSQPKAIVRLTRFNGLNSTAIFQDGKQELTSFKHSDGRRVRGYSIDDESSVDPLRAKGEFKIIDDSDSLSVVIESCSTPMGDSDEVNCQLRVNSSSAGYISCDANRKCILSLGVRTITMSLEQFGYDAWFGDAKLDQSLPCCTLFREAFAIRIR